MKRFLFLLCGSRVAGNSEGLARLAAESLPTGTEQEWLRLSGLPLPAFDDIRHGGDGIYPPPTGNGARLLEATLAATDLVFVAPLYWYGLPAAAKLYLDHWSGWLRVPGQNFKERMSGKPMWAITAYSDTDPRLAEPLFDTLRFTAEYMRMPWGGELLGFGNAPGEIFADRRAVEKAAGFFATQAETADGGLRAA